MATGHRAGQPQHVRRDDRILLRSRFGRRPDLTEPHPGQAHGPEQAGHVGRDQRQRPAVGDRQGRPVLPEPRAEPVAVGHGGADLAERQYRRCGPRRIVCGIRQPHARVGCAGDRPAELGDRREHLSVAGARVGRLPGRPQSRFAGRDLHPAGRAGPSALASDRGRLYPAARRLGPVRRARRGRHQVRRRRPVHHRRRLDAEHVGQCAPVRRPARGPGRDRVRQQRRSAQRGQPDVGRHAEPVRDPRRPDVCGPGAG